MPIESTEISEHQQAVTELRDLLDFREELFLLAEEFTIDGGALLNACERYKISGNESYVEDIAPAVWEETATNHVAAGTTGLLLSQINANVASILISEAAMTVLLNTLVKYERNRTKIDTNAATLTIYDDDCVTPLTVFDLRDFNGMPSVQEVCERVPQGC